MSQLLDKLAEARQAKDLSRLAAAIPYASWMNIAPENTTGELLTRMRYAPMLIGNTHLPALHGGTIGALLENRRHLPPAVEMDNATLPRIINITVDFLRSGRRWIAGAGQFHQAGATGRQRRRRAWQDDRAKPVGAAQLHSLVTPAK